MPPLCHLHPSLGTVAAVYLFEHESYKGGEVGAPIMVRTLKGIARLLRLLAECVGWL